MNIASLSSLSSSSASALASSGGAVQPAALSSTGHDMTASCNNPGCNCAGGIAAAAQLRSGGSVNLSAQGYALLQGDQGAGLATLLQNAVQEVGQAAASSGSSAAANSTSYAASQAVQAYREPTEPAAPLSALAALA